MLNTQIDKFNFSSTILSLNNHTNVSSADKPTGVESIDFEAYIRFRYTLSWLSLLVILIGLIGNALSFVILINPKMRISTNVFLSNLCVSGFIALFGLLVNSVIYELSAYYGLMNVLYILAFFYPYIYPIITTFQMASILLTVCVSVNQFICIYFAKLRTQTNSSKKEECKVALKVVMLMYIISIIYCIPYWLKFKFTKESGLQETDLGKDPLFKQIVHFYMYLPIAYIIPFSILIFTNAYLIGTITSSKKRRLRLGVKKQNENKKSPKSINEEYLIEDETILKTNANNDLIEDENRVVTVVLNNPIKKNGIKSYKLNFRLNKPSKPRGPRLRRQSSSKTSSRMSITVMLIAVVFLFFTCQFPVLIINIIQSMICSKNLHKCQASSAYQYSLVISKFLLISNLSFNFICYCLFSKKFRKVLRETFPTCFSLRDYFSFKIISHNTINSNNRS